MKIITRTTIVSACLLVIFCLALHLMRNQDVEPDIDTVSHKADLINDDVDKDVAVVKSMPVSIEDLDINVKVDDVDEVSDYVPIKESNDVLPLTTDDVINWGHAYTNRSEALDVLFTPEKYNVNENLKYNGRSTYVADPIIDGVVMMEIDATSKNIHKINALLSSLDVDFNLTKTDRDWRNPDLDRKFIIGVSKINFQKAYSILLAGLKEDIFEKNDGR